MANTEMSRVLKITMTKINSNESVGNLGLDSQLLRTNLSELQSLSRGGSGGGMGDTVQCREGDMGWELGAWTLQQTLSILDGRTSLSGPQFPHLLMN